MESESSPRVTTVPVHITQPADNAPPTLAEPASGPVAEMSGALQGEDHKSVSGSFEIVSATGASLDVNGEIAPSSEPTEVPVALPAAVEEKPSEQSAPTQVNEVKEAVPEPEPTTDDATAEPADTAAAPKQQNNGKRKSTGGVPEHKNKKLNKKKSMTKITHLDAQPGETFFARLKSYPPWPSIICDESMLPTSLLSTRPITTKKADGNYTDAYDDGGKKVADRTFPIMFLHTNEFAWIPNTDLTPYDPVDLQGDIKEKGKSKMLIEAYKVAAEGHDLQHFKDMLVAHTEAIQADIDAQAELDAQREAAKAAKADKKKRKSEAAADVEMEDADDDSKKSKKRKKAAESEDDDKPAKTPKTPKLKLTSPKDPSTNEKKKEKKEPKAKAEKRKSKAAVDADEEMPDAEEKEPEKPLDPAEERKAREKEVLFLRHKLQKGFLSRDQAPQEDEMQQMSSYIKKLEAYGDLEVSIIKATKINKVLKALIKLNTIPKDEEFKFRERSMEMLTKWNKLLGNDSGDADEKKAEPTTNGVHKEDKEEKVDPPAAETVTPTEVAPELTKDEAPVEIKETAPSTTAPAEPAPTEPTPTEPAPAPAPAPAEVEEAEKPTTEASKQEVPIVVGPAMLDVTVAPEYSAGALAAAENTKPAKTTVE